VNHRERVVKKVNEISKPGGESGLGQGKGKPAYCLFDIRHRGGANLVRAEAWNCGNLSLSCKGKRVKQRTCKLESTDGQHRGRAICSSNEVLVTSMERRDCVIQFFKLANSNERMS
jgi:hypothetical protein